MFDWIADFFIGLVISFLPERWQKRADGIALVFVVLFAAAIIGLIIWVNW